MAGSVVDEGGQPLAGVAVFLDGTTHGDVTGREGRFAVTARMPGGYLLVASHVGFKVFRRDVLLQAGKTSVLPTLVMEEEVIGIQVVIVEAMQPRRWYLRIFEEDVLGRSTVARRARLLNPEVL